MACLETYFIHLQEYVRLTILLYLFYSLANCISYSIVQLVNPFEVMLRCSLTIIVLDHWLGSSDVPRCYESIDMPPVKLGT